MAANRPQRRSRTRQDAPTRWRTAADWVVLIVKIFTALVALYQATKGCGLA